MATEDKQYTREFFVEQGRRGREIAAERCTAEQFKAWGRKGGKATKAKYGSDHFRTLAQQSKRKKDTHEEEEQH